MDFEMEEHNEKAYRKVQKMLRTSNIAAVVHPMLSNIDNIGIKFLGETKGRTLCVESDGIRFRGGMENKIKERLLHGKIDPKETKRFDEIEYITFSSLIMKMKEQEALNDYENILLMDLQFCYESVWKDGINLLLERNKNAKILELVEFSTIMQNVNNETFGRLKGHVASFISEEEGIKMGICGLISGPETNIVETKLKRKLGKIRKLEDKDLQIELNKKAEEIRKLNRKISSMNQKNTEEIELEDAWRKFMYQDEDDTRKLTEEEDRQNANEELEMLELRNRVRKLLEEIGEKLGEKHEKSELEALKDEYFALEEKEKGAKDLLGQVEKVKEEADRKDESVR